mgnify:CR=1 FL=1
MTLLVVLLFVAFTLGALVAQTSDPRKPAALMGEVLMFLSIALLVILGAYAFMTV